MMERRSWPWRRKTSEKASTVADSNLQSSNSGSDKVEDESKSIKYVQVPEESYARLTELEDEVKVLNEKYSSAQAEITTKDNLVKQHAKVAEEAVSGWEKAEAEATALKNQLESVMLMKLEAEEKVSHLDGALKECMKQIRNVKEESEQKLHDVIFAKTKQWEKVKLDLEAKLAEFEQELLRTSAENNVISRSLQERNNVLMRISEEKSHAEADIEVLKANVQTYEKEISSLKYELHVVSKELEIRNEEKNMSVRSAEVANKQHMEDVKKIAKLEAECQRLRGLVRKKLPGPAALAQMKMEVESLGREYGENKQRRSPSKNASPHLFQAPDYAFEQMQQFQKENEFLTARLLAMEEETKMLKEALSKRNGDLQASRSMCAKTANKLRSIEAHMYIANQQKSLSSANIDINFESSVYHNGSNQSVTSMSEDGIDDEASCAESWATALISELSHFKKDKDAKKGDRVCNSNQLELMDDFLEMERLACQSSETNGTSITATNCATDKMRDEIDDATSAVDIQKNGIKELDLDLSTNDGGQYASNKNDKLLELQSRIVSLFDSKSQKADMGKILEDIRHILDDTQDEIHDQSEVTVKSETQPMDAFCEERQLPEELGVSTDCISLKQVYLDTNLTIDGDLKIAISQIHDLIILFNKKAMEIQSKSFEEHDLSMKFKDFSATTNKILQGEISLGQFVSALSHILSVVSYKLINCTVNEGEGNMSDCVDKGTLSENRGIECEKLKERSSSRFALASPSGSDPEIEGHIVPSYELVEMKATCSFEEFEKLKVEKESSALDLVKCTETLESTKLKLVETEKQVEELKSELANCQKSNSLAETQLKCMAESYKLLESRSHDLESEINLFRAKTETLDNELQEEKRSHLEDVNKLSDMQAQLERAEKCLKCSASDEDADIKMKQETEIAAAAEKLAQCQESILLLGRQLQALGPPAELADVSSREKSPLGDNILEHARTSGFSHQEVLAIQQIDHMEMENVLSSVGQKAGCESPFDGHNSYMSPSDAEPNLFQGSPISSKRQRQRSTTSAASSFSTNTVSEKHGRGFSRFFSKGKSEH